MKQEKIIPTLIIFIALAMPVSAYYCANPLSYMDMCRDVNVDEHIAIELCCPEIEYPMGKIYPESRDHCIANFLSETREDLAQRCDLGCCLNLITQTCASYTARAACESIFSTRYMGSCTRNTSSGVSYAIPSCEEGCCCNVDGFRMGIKSGCTGLFNSNIDEISSCQEFCSSKSCIDGCQLKRPMFCRNGNLYEDCTGGDGVIGNGNDCGCPLGSECQKDGRCKEKKAASVLGSKERCVASGFKWCDSDSSCRESCMLCSTPSVARGSICADSCEDVKCGTNSACSEGKCMCDSGYFDGSCRASGMNIDYDRSGCVKKDPCISSRFGLGNVFLVGLSLLFLFMLLLLFRRSRQMNQ